MKRIISAILICALMLCITPVVPYAHEDFDDCSYVADLFASLEIDFRVSDGVTRAQFIYDIMQIIKSSNIGSDEAECFSDVSYDEYYFDALSAAVALGIVSKGTHFRPDDTITLNEVCKILVLALGKGFEAEAKGGYPSGYIVVANSNNIIPQMTEDRLSVASMNSLMDRFLYAQPYIMDGVGANPGDAFYVCDETILEYYFDIVMIEGVVTATENTGMYLGSAASDDGFIAIEDTEYKTKLDVLGHIGKNCVAYVKEFSKGKSEVVYIREHNNTSVAIDGIDIISVSEGRVSYCDKSGAEKSISLSAAPAYIYNSKADASFSSSQLYGFNGTVEFISNDGDKRADIVILKKYELIYVSSINSYDKTIFDVNGVMSDFDSDDIYVTIIKNNAVVDFGNISEGDLIKKYTSKDKMIHILEIVPVSNISGVVSSISREEKYIIVDDKEFEYDNYFEKYYINSCSLGAYAEFLITDDGKIFAINESTDDDMNYGYFIAMARVGTLDISVKAKMLCEDGSVSVLDFAEKVIIDGTRFKSEDIVVDGTEPTIVPGLIRYRTNDENKIKLIDTAEHEGTLDENLSVENNLTLYKFPSDRYDTIWCIDNWFAPYFRVSSSTKVFVVSDDEQLSEEHRYTVHSGTYFSTNNSIDPDNLLAYNVSSVGDTQAVVVKGGSGTQSVGTSSLSGVVISANEGIDNDGEECIIVTIFTSGRYERFYLSDEQLIKSLQTGDSECDIPLAPGDYVRYNSRVTKHINAISKEYDNKSKKVIASWGNHASGNIYYYGYVYDKDGNMISIAVENNPKFIPGVSDSVLRYNMSLPSSFVVYDSQTGMAYSGKSDDIITYINSPDYCGKILVRCFDGRTTYAILYK